MANTKNNKPAAKKPAPKKTAAGKGKRKQLSEPIRKSPRERKKPKQDEDNENYDPAVDNDAASDLDVSDDGQESDADTLRKQLEAEQKRVQQLEQKLALSSQINQHRLKSGRSRPRPNDDGMTWSSYNTATMNMDQRMISKVFKNEGWRLFKFCNKTTLPKVCAVVAECYDRAKYAKNDDDDHDASKYWILVHCFCFLKLSL